MRLPFVAGARVLRVWGTWEPTALAHEERVETRAYGWQLLAWFAEVPLLLLAAAAVVRLRQRWREIAVLLASLVAVTATALLTYGNQRFRAPAEPAIALLAACGLLVSFSRSRVRAR